MSYTSRNELPVGTSLKRVVQVVDLLGYRRLRGSLRVPNMVGSYQWYDEEDYRSWSGVELQIYQENGMVAVDTRSTVSRSYWDITHQNKTIKLIRDLFGGCFDTDAGRNRYWRPEEPPTPPLVSGCYLARWRFKNALIKSQIYLWARKLEGDMAREKPTGFHFMDAMNPRLLSNNLLVPFIVAVWEEYFRSTFAAVLKYADRREQVLKKARLNHTQLEQIAINKKPVEQTISECFSFQRPSIIAENFRILDAKLDLAAALRKPYKRRKVTLFDQIEGLVEGRNAFVHAGDMDLSLYDKELERVLTDIVEAVDRCYQAIGTRFGFTPLTDY
ncbi:hypothetical protein [Novosphingobium sp. SCN 63-17]|uniref:hypothetical protein n=1 Tax=Novosphingobium sp. SCN 63-17 TaxID=1660120 RepID=UPI00086DB771|nr:hypothetical protein [Novosphingobium sp. SCN 63-17]ODU80992.1 MAG: hypothetical protein ABT10_15470 [Novosphingobium sp. SCN 63-17]